MTYAKAIVIIFIWMAPAMAIIFTKEAVLGWGFLFAVFATEYVTKWKEVEVKNNNDEDVINIRKKFNDFEYSSREYTDRFKELLDDYVFCDESELTNGAKKLRYKLMKFCIDILDNKFY